MSPALSNNALPGLNLQTDLGKKPSAPRTPRVDVEPLYTAVKSAISDADWTTYKKALSFFLLGNLNQEELSHSLSRILTTPALEHAHNALFTAIYANAWRDPPEAGIASWVSSSDKPSSGTVKGTHDESEKRLKHEVMQLSRRERKRLKTIPTADGDAGAVVQEYIEARKVKQPESGPVGGNQGGGFGKTSTSYNNHTHTSHPNILTPPLFRLGPRNPQTLYFLPLRRNPRIPHPHHNNTPPASDLL